MTTVHAPVTVAGPVTGWRVIHSEWTKFRSLRSSWWSVAASTVLTIGFGVATSLAAAAEKASSSLPKDVAARSEIGTILAQLALGTLAVLLVSGEYGTGMVRSSMAAVPKRLPVLWAKLAVYVAVVLPVTLVTSLAAFQLGQVVWRAQGRAPVSLGGEDVLRIVVGAPLYLTVAGISALAVGTLLRSTAGGITVVVGLFFVLPVVMQAMPERIADGGRFLPSNAGGALSRIATSPHPLEPWTGFALLCCYAVVLVGAAAWRLRRTDV